MIVWSGFGFLPVLVFFVTMFCALSLFPEGVPDDYSFILGLFIAGAFSWIMGRKWNREEGRIVVDKDTGEEVLLKPNHTLFWINIQYWGYIFAVLGIIVLIQNL